MNLTSAIEKLHSLIPQWANDLGFDQMGVSDIHLESEKANFDKWIKNGYQGDMQWIEEGKNLRFNPEQLHPKTCRILSFRMNYLPQDTQMLKVLKCSEKAYISRYALGRDYHKLIRKRLTQLAKKIEQWCIEQKVELALNQRPFVDSAPVLERPVAEKAGLGWTGKHTLILNKQAGSWFFLGEIFTNLPLPINKTIQENACGDCTACLKVCPTDAFAEPYVLNAKRCISYLTIENKGIIAQEFREPIGNRVFGCDDCQAICPWNKYAKHSKEDDFTPRHNLDNANLLALFRWDEATFLEKTQGSPIRRIGYQRWQRNLAVGLGNGPSSDEAIHALQLARKDACEMVAVHIDWAIEKLLHRRENPNQKPRRKIKAK